MSDLNSIISLLKIHISTLCAIKDFDENSVRSDIFHIIQSVDRVEASEMLSTLDREALGKINKLSAILLSVYEERQSLEKVLQASSRSLTSNNVNNLPGHPITNTYDMRELVNDSDADFAGVQTSFSDIGHRKFSDFQLSILRSWYNTNKRSPYLNDESLVYLIDITGLSGQQVRNWYVYF